MKLLSQIWKAIQGQLFPYLEEEIGPLTDKVKQVVRILELVRVEEFIIESQKRRGRKSTSRKALARAFVIKAVYNLNSTRALIDQLANAPSLRRICGYETGSQIPNESTFSRAFDEFSQIQLAERVHEALIETHQKERLVGHLSRDSTAIEGNEKPVCRCQKTISKAKRKRGRPKKGEVVPPKEPSRFRPSRRNDFGGDAG
jgi:transposase